jgi:hypothetical protein
LKQNFIQSDIYEKAIHEKTIAKNERYVGSIKRNLENNKKYVESSEKKI